SGMSGTSFGPGFSHPSGVDIDPAGGGVWIANRDRSTFELWSEGVSPSLVKTLGSIDNGNVLNGSVSLGIDSSGNYFAAVAGGNFGDDVVMFLSNGPFNVPSKRLLGGFNTFNQKDAKGMNSGNGVAIYEGASSSQLIVLEGDRVSFW